MPLVKIHKSYRTVVAICDKELLGKKFEENNRCIDLTTKFFQGEDRTEKEVTDIIKHQSDEDAIFNIIGEESIKIALETGIIKPEGIRKIKDIPVALVLL